VFPRLAPGDPARRLAAQLVAAIANLLLVATLAFSVVAIVGPIAAPRLYLLTLPAGVLLLLAIRQLVRIGRVRTASLLLCIGGLIITSADLYTHGANTVAAGAFLLMTVIAGLTVGPLGAVSLAAAAVALLGTVMLGTPGGEPLPSASTRWVHYAVQLVLGSVLVAWWAQATRRLVGELRESEARHARVLDGSPDAIVALDRDGVVTYCNQAFEHLFGYPASDFVGQHWTKVPTIPTEGPTMAQGTAVIDSAMKGKPTAIRETRLLHRDGHTVIAEVHTVPLHDAGQVIGAISTLRDVTARKEAEAERESLQEQLFRAQRMEAVGRFAGGIAHDFNNILTVIFHAVDAIRERDLHEAATADVLDAATRGASLARQLLTFSRQEPVAAQSIDLHVAILALRPMLERLVGAGVRVETDLDPRHSATVRLGAGQLDQVLVNLTVNAKDAMPRGGTIRIATRWAAGATASASSVELSFSDSGVGMDAATVAKAFEPFFTTKGQRGTGLGLGIVQRIVQDAEGTLSCESQPGHGTTFRIVLPAPVAQTVVSTTLPKVELDCTMR
jgi:PAS domain S-box-containing protein